METIANIQADVRFHTQKRDEVITSGEYLRIFNSIYQGLTTPDFIFPGTQIRIGRRWAEYTHEDTSLTTTAGTEQYTFPVSPVFKDPFTVELLDASSSNEPIFIEPAPNLIAWSQADRSQNGTPCYYRLIAVAGVMKIALRPKPDTTGDTIRITGLIEAKSFPATSTTTVDSDSASAQAVLNVADETIFTAGDHYIIGEGTAREERGIVLSTASGIVTGTGNLTYTHTAAQADVVALTTSFRHRNTDQALALLVASAIKGKRDEAGKAGELAAQAMALLPRMDMTPTLRPAPVITPTVL